ncbi:MAG TPA: hypothetical protein VKE40_28035 [Gemmataceae bacterium]|nr:hypothetical protein [Gemmataceae bacterium]
MTRAVGVSQFGFGWLVVTTCAARAADPPAKWEERAVAALAAEDRKALKFLAEDFQKLTPDARRDLPLRIREDSVEFAFRGEFPADKEPWKMLEYMVCDRGRDYETLLVAPDAELPRVEAMRPFFKKHSGEGRRHWWSARLVWAEAETPQSVELADLLAGLEPVERDRFRDELSPNGIGLGCGTNVKADIAALPRKRVPALLLLTLRVSAEK